MAKSKKVEVEYSLINKTFNDGIKEVNKGVNTLNKEFKLQREQMKNTASESEKFEASLVKLNREYELAETKTNTTRTALENMKEMFGENSEQARIWGDKLLDAERNQAFLQNRIQETTTSLSDYVKKEQESAQATLDNIKATTQAVEAESDYDKAIREATEASDLRKQALGDLSDEQDKLTSNTQKLNAEYELEKTKLGENASEISKVKLEKEYLAKQTKATADEISNMEKQLELTKAEYGNNSKEVNNLETEILEAKRANEEFTQSLKEKEKYLGIGKEAIQHYGEKLKTVGKAMSTYVTLPLVAGAGLAVKAASDWESAFADVRKTVDGTDDELLAIEDSLISLSTVMPSSAEELAEIAANAGQLGIETPVVLKFTETMAKLAATTDMTADTASTSLAQFANVMGTTSDEYERIASVIVELGNNTETTEFQIMEMSQRMAAQSKIIGLNEQQVMALSATLSSVGVNAEAGGSSMTRVFQKMDTSVKGSTKELAEFAKISGKSAEEFAEVWRNDPQTAILDFMEGLKGIQESGGDTAGILKDLGITSVNEIGSLQSLALASDQLGEAFLMAGEAYDNGLGENSALSKEAAVRFGTFESQLITLKNQIKALNITIGGPLISAASKALEALTPVLEVIAKWADMFAEADVGTQQLIMAVVGIVAAIGPLLTIIGSLMTAAGGIAAAIGVVMSAIGTLVSGFMLLLSWPALIIAGVVALVVALALNWDAVTEKFKSSYEEWVAIFTAIGQFFADKFNEIYTTVATWVGNIATWVAEKWNAISTSTGNLVSDIGKWFSDAYQTTKTIWSNITNWISTKIGNARDKVRDAINAIKGFLKFEWKWPRIPIPVFSFSGSVNPLDWGDKNKRPNIGVNWKYLAKGGVFDQATLFPSGHVVGEAGPEAVLPLNREVLGNIGRGIVESTEAMQQFFGGQQNTVVLGDIELVVGTKTMARMLINDIEYEQEVKVRTDNRNRGRKI